jgi:RNA polymerase sigma-70 factor (ECF subfamily)
MTNAVETTLFLRFKQGDRKALGQLLEHLRPYVRVIVQSIRRERPATRADESDLIQDVLMNATSAAATFEGNSVGELVCWMRTIVVRTTRRGLRRAGEHGIAKASDRDEPLATGNCGPAETAIQQEQAARIAEAVSRLPDEMRQVLLLRVIDDLDHAEIGSRMNRSPGAVRMLFVRSLERLRLECGDRDQWLIG